MLVWLPRSVDWESLCETLGGNFGCHGLGQYPKDFLTGALEEHSFLSKRFVVQSDEVGLIPVAERLYKAGVVRNLDCPHSAAEQLAAMAVAHADLPRSLFHFYGRRFLDSELQYNERALAKMSLEDWGFRLKMRNGTFSPELDEQAERLSEQKWSLKVATDAPELTRTCIS